MNSECGIKKHIREFKRPWKLLMLFIGISLLVAGSFYYQAPDWDIPISFIMAIMSYLTASWSMHVVLERRWKWFPLMLFYTWFSIDGCYWIYWHFKDPVALALMREGNFFASLSLYGMCGLVWYYEGTLKQFIAEAREKLIYSQTHRLRRVVTCKNQRADR